MRIGDFIIRRLDKDTCAVTQYKGSEADVVIPSVIDRYTAVSVESSFLRKGNRVRSITVPKTVESISTELFPLLCHLEAFIVEKGSHSYRSEDGVLYDSSCYSLVFYPPEKDTECFMPPKKLGCVASGAFSCGTRFRTFGYTSKLEEFHALPSQCPNLEAFVPEDDSPDHEGVLIHGRTLLFYPPQRDGSTYSIPDGIEEVAALSGEPFFPVLVKKIFMPSSLRRGMEKALGNAEAADAGHGSAAYLTSDGVLYSRKSELIAYPGRKSDEVFVTPEGTMGIGDGAFRGSRLKTLVIAEGVSAIGNAAFEGSSITSLVIPASVRDIGVRALSGAKNLRSVFVRNGSVAEIFLRGEGRDDLIKRTGSLF